MGLATIIVRDYEQLKTLFSRATPISTIQDEISTESLLKVAQQPQTTLFYDIETATSTTRRY